MKKLIALMLTLCILAGATACGGTTAAAPEPAAETADAADEPLPAEEATPEPAEESASAMETELFACDIFTVTIPKGWGVSYEVYDSATAETYFDETGKKRDRREGAEPWLWIVVRDNVDRNNVMFYFTFLGPYFTSVEQKERLLPALARNGGYEWSPVLDDLTAEEVLKNWGPMYTMLTDADRPFINMLQLYKVEDIHQANIADSSNRERTASEVFASVSIKSADQPYGMYFYDELQHEVFSGDTDYYASYNNYAFVIGNDHAADVDVLMDCLKSFDFTGFNTLYGNK